MTDSLLNKPLTLKLLTPQGEIFSGEGVALYFRSSQGDVGIEPGFESSLFDLDVYRMRFLQADAEAVEFTIHQGFLKITDNEITVLADSAESKDAIDLQRAEDAKQRATRRLQESKQNTGADIDIARAEFALKRAIQRINSAQNLPFPE